MLIKVLIISSEFPPGPGGIGQHAASFALAFSVNKEVHVLANQDYTNADELKKYHASLPNSIRITAFANRSGRFTFLRRLRQSFVLTKNLKPNQVYVTGRFPLWAGALIKLLLPKQSVFGFAHGTEVSNKSGVLGKITCQAAKRLDHVYAVSRFTAQFLKENGLKNISILPNGLDRSYFELADETSENLNLKGHPKLLTVGNVTPRKGQHRVIQALPTMLKSFPNLHYHIVGLPTQKQNLEVLAHNLGVASAITFHGLVPTKAELMRVYKSCNIFIMLSENQPNGDVEGFGIAILEANALGIPAVGARGCGIEDAISNESGVLVDGDNEEEICRAIKAIMNNYEKYSKCAKAWAKKHDWSSLVKDIN